MNQHWGRVKKAKSQDFFRCRTPCRHSTAGKAKKAFAPECICLEWEKPDIDVDIMINKESILNWHWKMDTAQFYIIKFLKPV